MLFHDAYRFENLSFVYPSSIQVLLNKLDCLGVEVSSLSWCTVVQPEHKRGAAEADT